MDTHTHRSMEFIEGIYIFSNVHKIFVGDTYLLSAFKDCKYNSIVISEHAPVGINITLLSQRKKQTWLFVSYFYF